MATVLGNMTLNTLIEPAPPYDAEIEYLESTGTQYVDTGILLAQSGKVVEYRVKFAYTSLSTSTSRYSVCGAYDGSGNGRRNGYVTTMAATSQYMAVAIGSSAPNTSVTASAGTVYDFTVKIDSPSGRITVASGGSNILDQSISGDFPTITNYLFARNGTTAAEFSSARIYAFSQIVDGTIVRDFVPVRVGQTGYLYDRVSGQLFGNAGTGDFVLGPDVDVHNALTRADANFTNIRDWLTSSEFEFSPTITFNSGWSAKTAIKIKVIAGRIGCITGTIRCSSALTAGTSYVPISSISYPSGISLVNGSIISSAARAFIYFNNAGTHVLPEVNTNANTNIYFRGMIPLKIDPDVATSYIKHIAPLF